MRYSEHLTIPELDTVMESDDFDMELSMINESYGVTATLVDPHGPGGGNPVIKLEGKRRNVITALQEGWKVTDDELWSLFRVADPSNEHYVVKTTFDKLQQSLNGQRSDGWLPTPFFIGGRDWVLVCERDDATPGY